MKEVIVGISQKVKIWAITVASTCMKTKIIKVDQEVDLEANFMTRLHHKRVLQAKKVLKIERAVANRQIEATKMMQINSNNKMRKMDLASNELLVANLTKDLN